MDYIEDDFTDALIDAICGKLPSTWYTLIGVSLLITTCLLTVNLDYIINN